MRRQPMSAAINPRPCRGGGLMQPPHEFFWAGRHTVWRIVLKFSIANGTSFAELLVKKNFVGSGQVTKLLRHKRNNLRKISAKSWVNATWRDAIELNGDSWWDWCQYMTRCDPWNCTKWGSRSTKVTWGHWPRLNSQWQITNRHMFSGVSWGAESESVVHCPQKRLQTTSSPSPWPITVIRPIWILTVTAMTAGEGDAVLLRSTTYAKYCNGIQ